MSEKRIRTVEAAVTISIVVPITVEVLPTDDKEAVEDAIITTAVAQNKKWQAEVESFEITKDTTRTEWT